MDKNIILHGEKVDLVSSTIELWHEFYSGYVIDPIMDDNPYTYDFERIEEAYYLRICDSSRLYFSIMKDRKVIGQIYLKHMDMDKMESDFGISLINDSVKGKGYGTEAIKLLIDYSANVQGFKSIIADSVHRNIRSQHVLEKLGFIYTREDEVFKYYRLEL